MGKRLAFALLVILPFLFFLVSKEIYWLCHLLILSTIIFEKNKLNTIKLNKNKSHLLLLLVIPLFWAFFLSFQASFYFVTQALFYLTTPFLLTFLGMKISRIANQQLVFKYIIYSGTIGALFYVGISFYFYGFESFTNPYILREFFAWGSIASVLTVFIVSFSEKFGIVVIRNKQLKYCIVGVNLLATYFSASRTYYFIFLIFTLVFLYNYSKKLTFLFLVFSIFFTSAFLISNSDNILIKKIQSGTTEISMGNYQTDEDIVSKYRGYESNMALETYLGGTELNLIFGHGFEKQVDLKTEVLLGDTFRRVIPVIHNGYLYLLIKEGFLGLIFYFIFFVKLFKFRYHTKEFLFFNIIITCCIFSLLFSNYVVGTFFSMEMSLLWIVFGIYIGYMEMARRMKKKINSINIPELKKF